MKNIVELLKEKGKTVSAMESCTGGGVANRITNFEGASDVIEFSAVTYSNAFKKKMGVDGEVIEKYSVYSIETAREMAKSISFFAESDFGIGITGKLCRFDKNNLSGDDNTVFVSIYSKDTKGFLDFELVVDRETREENKELVIDEILARLETLL